MVPCYNAAESLPMALASLLAQSYTNWECIVVDDGSTDNPKKILDIIDDNRIRFVRFETNKGRAVARQKGLDLAQGKYLCMIDADDWIYPWKLERQVEIMESYPQLSVLSAGLAIIDEEGQIIGVRVSDSTEKSLEIFPPMRYPQLPPFAHASSILKTSVARQYGYNLDYVIAEDAEFLLRVILNQSYGRMRELVYSYSESQSYSLKKAVNSIRANQRMFVQFRQMFFLTVVKQIVRLIIIEFLYRCFTLLGLEKMLIKRRSGKPTEEHISEHSIALNAVIRAGSDTFKDTPYERCIPTR
jgi:glycosyltransferase involved in cell wall biosynthesis